MTPNIRKRNARRLAFQLVGLGLILFGCFIRVMDPYPVRAMRLTYFDILQRLSPREFTPDLPVRVLDIDEKSLARSGQWPWPRTQLGELVDRLSDYGAAAVAFDMLFAEPDRYSPSRLIKDPALAGVLSLKDSTARLDNDRVFAEKMEQLPVVLGVAARLTDGGKGVVPKMGLVEIGEQPSVGLFSTPHWTTLAPPLADHAAGIGGVNVSPLGGLGVVRKVPVLWSGPDGVLPGLGLEALRVALGEPVLFADGAMDEVGIMLGVGLGDFTLPTTENGEIWVRYRRDDPRLYLSAHDVMQTEDDPALRDQIEGRIILVGTSAAGLFDMRETALGESVPGVSIHAQIIEQILLGDMLHRTDVTSALELVAFVALGVVVTVVMSSFGAVASFIAGGVAAAAVMAISWMAFQNQAVLFDATFPLIGGMANFGLLVGYQFISSEREKRMIRQTFSHYVAPEILDELESSGHSLQLGGETQDITVMFSDIRGFTPLSEAVSATDLVAILNALFSEIGDQILVERGTIDKFIGDAVMAFWNAPLPVPDHPLRAAQAALLMRQALARFNASPIMKNNPPIALATGCAAGFACVGNIGSQKRFNYTVIGDVVNVAARIEQNCRHVDYDILLSTEIRRKVGDRLAMLEAGYIDLKGKSEPEAVYILVGDNKTKGSAEFVALANAHQQLIDAIRVRAPRKIIREICTECQTLGQKVEPGLFQFYNGVPNRTADFRSKASVEKLVFSHNSGKNMTNRKARRK
ncbi:MULTISPECIES: CHASE2 domain-containing protein [unclassified Ruegeria]|uniref:CHASE2 domain-containing protein n=1 Tax=unclassified Ruegeria TaxID=2625375 RepID=UPI0020C1CCF9|nr:MULTISPECIES: adenylate/guanylate cyclase domain-containing protein [unclassified Ruegeria]